MAEERFAPRLLFDFFLHEADNIHSRVDWFLIFHGILFEAFLAAHYAVHRITLGVLGSLVSYVWLVAGIRQLWNLRQLVASVKDQAIMGPEAAALFTGMFNARTEYQHRLMRWARATPAFCIVLPLAVFLAWLVVTATYGGSGIGQQFFETWRVGQHPLRITACAIVLLTVVWLCVPGPNIPDKAIACLRANSASQNGETQTDRPTD
jgi:hypothetical protein